MSLIHEIPELEAPREGPASAVEQAKYLANAARLVEGFSQKCAPGSLDAMLAAAGADSPEQAAELARQAAANACSRAETLLDEVERFLALTKPQPNDPA